MATQRITHKYLLPLRLLLATSLISSSLGSTSAPIVDLGYAQYQGSIDSTANVTTFLGIRYAAPPTGAMRWQAPIPPSDETGVQQATEFPAQCYQGPFGGDAVSPFVPSSMRKREEGIPTNTSEDCLFLDVYTPGSSLNQSLPVMVWIHGGGYVSGNASLYEGRDIIRESNYGVVVVIIQYRLGVFGFLAGSEVSRNGALNAGLLDQNFALQWVQKHVTLFGGDASKVTIWGESAGAGSVLQHLVAHSGQTNPPLFRGAITSSTFLPSQYNYNDTIPQTLYNDVVSQTERVPIPSLFSICSSSSDTLTCLRFVDANLLGTVNTNISNFNFYGTYTFVPVVDGTFIVERPTLTINNGTLNGEALLSVTNAFEGENFVDATGPTSSNVTQYITELFPDFGPQQIQNASGIYTALGGTTLSQVIGVMGESIFICPTYYLLKAFNGKSHKGEFAIPPAIHGEDVAYYFPTYIGPPAYNNTVFAKAFSESFMSFIISLDPNAKFDPSNITPQWNTWSQGDTEMLFNETEAGQPVVQTYAADSALLERCAFWNSVGAFTAQ